MTKNRFLFLFSLVLGSAACGGEQGPQAELEGPAVELFTQVPGSSVPFNPVDAKATSRDVIWLADDGNRVIMRLDVPHDEYGMLGMRDEPPIEVVRPARIAVRPDIGILAYDAERRDVSLFTPGGEHIRSRTLDFLPSFMDFTEAPIGVVFAAATMNDSGEPALLIVRSGVLLEQQDTLLSANRGPEAIRSASGQTGKTAITASEHGAWIWSDVRPDSLYELTGKKEARRLGLRRADWAPTGILADRQRDIVWVVRVDSATTHYAAYDVSGSGLLAGDRYLGGRTTGASFTPQAAYDGAVLGWDHKTELPFAAAGYDMLVERFPGKQNPKDSRGQ